MKIKITSKLIEKLMAKAIMPIPTNPVIFALGYFLLEVKDNEIIITGSDMMSVVEAREQIKSEGNCKILIPAKLAYNLIATLNEDIVLNIKEKKLVLENKTGNFNIPILTDLSDYPQTAEVSGTKIELIPKDVVLRAIQFVEDCIASDNIRASMAGVLFDIMKDCIKIVATNGHKLSIFRIDVNTPNDLIPAKIVIPKEAISILKKYTAKDGNLDIIYNQTHVKFIIDNDIVVSRLIGDAFPAYEKVIPENNNIEAYINKSDIISSIKRLNLLSYENSIKTELLFKENSLLLKTENAEQGRYGEEKYECKFSSDELLIAFDGVKLFKTLDKYPSSEIKLSFKNASSAMVVTDPNDDRSYSLLMPMRM